MARLTDSQKEKIKKLDAKGKTAPQISEELGIGVSTIYYQLKKLKDEEPKEEAEYGEAEDPESFLEEEEEENSDDSGEEEDSENGEEEEQLEQPEESAAFWKERAEFWKLKCFEYFVDMQELGAEFKVNK